MSLINEAIQEEIEEEINETISNTIDNGPGAAPGSRIGDILPDMSFLLSETGPGGIDEYMDHTLNIHQSPGVARVIRGATGLLGNLNYALIDIGLGGLEVIKEGKTKIKGNDNEVNQSE